MKCEAIAEDQKPCAAPHAARYEIAYPPKLKTEGSYSVEVRLCDLHVKDVKRRARCTVKKADAH